MFQPQWHKKPKRQFSDVVANGAGRQGRESSGDGAGGSKAPREGDPTSSSAQGDQDAAIESINQQTQEFVRGDRLEKRDKQQAFFKRKVVLDQKRRQLAEGNIVQFELNPSSKHLDKKSEMNRMLFAAGLKFDEVLGLKMNDFANSKIEVHFKDDVIIDCRALEAKICKAGFSVMVSKYDLSEEVIDIFGLPLTSNIDELMNGIKHAIRPFVKKIIDIKPMTYVGNHNEKDFFHGHFNGNYRVTVVPLAEDQVPMYLVIGKEQAMAKAGYHRKSSDKISMCNDCFSTEHINFDISCPGVKPWEDYVNEFNEKWKAAAESHEEAASLTAEQLLDKEEAARVDEMNRIQSKNTELQEKVAFLSNEYQLKSSENEQLMAQMSDLESRLGELQMKMQSMEDSSTNPDLSEVSESPSVFVDSSNIEEHDLSKDNPMDPLDNNKRSLPTPSPKDDSSKKHKGLAGLPVINDWITFKNEAGSNQKARVLDIKSETILLQVKTKKNGLKELELELDTFECQIVKGPHWESK